MTTTPLATERGSVLELYRTRRRVRDLSPRWSTFGHRPLRRQKPASCRAFVSTATGIRTPVSAVRGRRPSPLDDGGQRRASVRVSPDLACVPGLGGGAPQAV